MKREPALARLVLSPHAQSVYEQLDDDQRQLFGRILKVITNAPEDGPFYMETRDGQGPLRQMTGNNMHVIYRFVLWPVGNVLQIVVIEIHDWQPREDTFSM